VGKQEASLNDLQDLFDYNPVTGVLRWKVNRSNVKAGTVVTCQDGKGYLLVTINKRMHKAHRVAWMLHHQSCIPPNILIDHVNGVKDDNRAINLRLATKQQNSANLRGCNRSNKTSEIRGVCWYRNYNKWRSYVRYNGKMITIGYFATKEEAARAVEVKRLELFGDFAGRSQSTVEED
jgi:hypothetical protein